MTDPQSAQQHPSDLHFKLLELERPRVSSVESLELWLVGIVQGLRLIINEQQRQLGLLHSILRKETAVSLDVSALTTAVDTLSTDLAATEADAVRALDDLKAQLDALVAQGVDVAAAQASLDAAAAAVTGLGAGVQTVKDAIAKDDPAPVAEPLAEEPVASPEVHVPIDTTGV